MARFFKLAMVQLASDVDNLDLEARKAGQKAKIDRYLDTILGIDPVVDLLVFPETTVSGFDPAHWTALAESIPGPTSDYFCRKASELGTWICPGSIIEKRVGLDGTYNTSLLISPSGEIVLKYSKVFVPYPFEQSLRGSDFPVCEIPGVGRVGIMICADHAVPEVARNLAFNGAELILNPTCQGIFIGGIRHLVPLTQVRAIENQCYLVAVNQAAPQGMGHSLACDPEGRILEELESARVLRPGHAQPGRSAAGARARVVRRVQPVPEDGARLPGGGRSARSLLPARTPERGGVRDPVRARPQDDRRDHSSLKPG